MNFPFRILVLDDNCRKCKLYTILKYNSQFNEAVKFVKNKRNKESEDFGRLKARIDYIKNRHGARLSFFKSEGTESDLVQALHASAKKQGYLQLNHLRWYCIRLSEKCIILGNGGVKHVSKTQQDDFLQEKEQMMRWVDQCVAVAFDRGHLNVNDDGVLYGDLDLHYKCWKNMDYDKEKSKQIWDEFLSLSSSDSRFIRKQMDIAAQIDTYLKETKLTQRQLAERAGLRPSQISQILAGLSNPTLRTIVSIEEALGKEVIVCPEFFEEELEGDGWMRPIDSFELDTKSYRTFAKSSESKLSLAFGWGKQMSLNSNHFESESTGSHHKPTG